jgi:hypothetical protein
VGGLPPASVPTGQNYICHPESRWRRLRIRPKTNRRTQINLNGIVSAVKDHFIYNYDFGDNWELKLVLESIIEHEENTFYPRCIAGGRNAPPEDSGGIWGYHEYCQAIRNPQHPQHEELLEWRGPFDPEHFSADEINQELRFTFTPRKSRPKKSKAWMQADSLFQHPAKKSHASVGSSAASEDRHLS